MLPNKKTLVNQLNTNLVYSFLLSRVFNLQASKSFILILLILVTYCILPTTLHAQFLDTPSGDSQGSSDTQGGALAVARIIQINEKSLQDGHIISSTDKGPALSSTAYDPQVIGVVSRNAAIVLSPTEMEGGTPVVSTGTTYVLVSTKDGPIKTGDLITTSTVAGVGVKAIKSGYVIGRALEEYSASNPQQVAAIAVDLDLHYFNSKPTLAGSLTDIFKIALLPTKDSPTPIFKYFAAAAVVIASFVLAFLSFGRTAAKGIEALGRNPAAGKIIHLGIIFNISIVVVIVLAGLVVSFLILRL